MNTQLIRLTSRLMAIEHDYSKAGKYRESSGINIAIDETMLMIEEETL